MTNRDASQADEMWECDLTTHQQAGQTPSYSAPKFCTQSGDVIPASAGW